MARRKLIVGLVVLLGAGLVALLVLRSGQQRNVRAQEFEGKAGARALCLAVSEYHQARGAWIQAGPLPLAVPGPEGLDFPKVREFQQLGFDPGHVHFQYEVRADEDGGSECIARGDPDGDGTVSVFRAQAR
jgi:hypothetical protein